MKLIELFLLPEEAANEQEVIKKTSQKLSVSNVDFSYRIARRSIDARSRAVKVRLVVEVFFKGENINEIDSEHHFQQVSKSNPVIVVGCGPAGMFAALRLI